MKISLLKKLKKKPFEGDYKAKTGTKINFCSRLMIYD